MFLCVSAVLQAQEFRATISGYVYDSSGAAVPNAKVEAVSVANNATTSTTADSSGAYTIPFLTPGNYKLTASATGFKQSIRDDVILEAGRIVGVNITLEVGDDSGRGTTAQLARTVHARIHEVRREFPWRGHLASAVRQQRYRRVARQRRTPVRQ